MANLPFHTHDFEIPSADQAAAEAGSRADVVMTPLATKQSIAAEVGETIASAAQGALASTAVQPSNLGDYITPVFDSPEVASSANLANFSTVTVNRSANGRTISPHRYSKVPQPANVQPSTGPKFQSLDGAWWGLDEKTVRPSYFGVTGSGNDTTAVQAAANYAMATGCALDLDGTWRVTSLTWGNGTTPFNVVGRAFIIGIATVATDAILVFDGDKFTLSGFIKVDGQRSTLYSYGWWAKGAPNFQFVNLMNLSSDRCPVAFKIGNLANPNALISEIVVNGGGTYSCPVVGIIEGTETYVSLMGSMKPANSDSGDSAWQSRVKRGLIVKGAYVKVIGGELIQAGSAAATDFLIELQPANKADGSLNWGEVELAEVHVETAGPLALISNPDGFSGTISNRGLFRVSGCSGYHSQDTADFVQVAAGAGFTGRIVEGGNTFRCPIVRTKQNINTNGNACDVYPSLVGFGPNFKPWYAGITGGSVHGVSEDLGTGTWTPVVTTGGGSGIVATATGYYRRVAGMVFVQVSINIANNGSGSGTVIATMPFAPSSGTFVISGRANSLSGKLLQGVISATATMVIRNFDNTYPGATGESLLMSGWYEPA